MANVRVTDEKITDIADSIRQKKNESTQYTLDEMKSAVDSLSSPQGKTIIFRNLDESGGQKFIVTKTLADSELEGSSQDLVVDPPDIKYNFYLRCHTGYIPGTIDHETPINYNDLGDGEIITAQPGYLASSTDRQLVDMTDYYTNNKANCLNNQQDFFSNDAVDYFKTIKPTSLNNAFKGLTLNYSENTKKMRDVFLLLDTSECTDFSYAFADLNIKNYQNSTDPMVINLTGLNVSKSINFSYTLSSMNTHLIVDITGWDTSNCTNADFMFQTINRNIDFIGLETLTFPNCTSFSNTLDFYDLADEPKEYLNLQNWKVSNKCTNLFEIFYRTRYKIIDITGWDTSGVTNFQYMMRESPCTELRGVLDMASAVQNWQGYQNMVKGDNLQVPINIKNPPSPSDWWQKAGFTSEDQFEIVT